MRIGIMYDEGYVIDMDMDMGIIDDIRNGVIEPWIVEIVTSADDWEIINSTVVQVPTLVDRVEGVLMPYNDDASYEGVYTFENVPLLFRDVVKELAESAL